MTDFVVIAGLSGAGRSSVANVFEDLGWFVIDNLPTPLISKVVELAAAPGTSIERVALVVGSQPVHGDVVAALAELRRSTERVNVVFLEASTDVLVRRYESTRRRHPQGSGERLAKAIDAERALLETVKGEADLVIDTSELNIHQLRARVVDLFGQDRPDEGMQTTLVSFGYKHGLPLDVDMVFDCRFLPNPYWVDRLRPLTGRDGEVRDYVLGQEATEPFLEHLDGLVAMLLPAFVDEGKAYLTIALGCTGGRHRSVVITEALADRLRARGVDPTVMHRDADR